MAGRTPQPDAAELKAPAGPFGSMRGRRRRMNWSCQKKVERGGADQPARAERFLRLRVVVLGATSKAAESGAVFKFARRNSTLD